MLAPQPASAAVIATFTSTANLLTVIGDAGDNTIVVGRTGAGSIVVNDGAVAINGGTPSVANVTKIQVFGQVGDDVVELDESNGALPAANLFGGSGADTVTGGRGADLLFGQSGDDTLTGRLGRDHLFGGSEADLLIGGDGDDGVFGESGDDRMAWNPGDDTDLNEGGADIDTVEIVGGNASETFTLAANGSRVRFDRVDAAQFSLDIGARPRRSGSPPAPGPTRSRPGRACRR